ncbi:efflux transporter outer membrane subunit [Aquabacterium sp.]|uniref:efflux transporter outer membrane subunit n=1 Tax=Aquabacterium sp. TaxID=1872578 RepID=UPI002C05C488|nr:efflux transporter outer membrane subunit [Aquabacterium sp.]HSW05272.1 efflux transporter outer membrane subunit [Aquabacterium sp.]
MPSTRRHSLIPVLICLLAGCTLGPDYKRPQVSLPDAWQATPALTGAEAGLTNSAWWSAFGDPVLDALIRSALDDNKNLRIAAYRIEQFEARVQVTASAGKPQVSAGASRTRDTLSQNKQVPLAVGTEPVDNAYMAAGAVNWELDFWGRFRRANEAAQAELLAAEENRRALVLTLVAELASAYLRLRTLDSELDLLSRLADSRRESLRLLELKLAGGGSSELPVLQARAELEEALAELPAKENQIVELEHALSLLLGRDPGPIPRGKTLQALALPAVPGGLPADLLVQRPDLRKAEQDLVAANARIGVAKAQYLPTIALTTQSGFASNELSKLSLLSSNFGTFGATLLGPIFTSGRIAGQVREAEAVQREKATAYLLAVQTALREVEDALVANAKMGQRSTIRTRQIRALGDLRDYARKRYEGGRSAYLEVLETERNLLAGELQQLLTRRDQYIALVAVYKAMGGGWTVAEPTATSTSQMTKTKHE